MPSRLLLPLVALLSASTAFAQNSTSASAACADIDTALPGEVAYAVRDYTRFETELHAYWSQADSDLVPQCIVFPLNANDTSTVVQVLNKYEDVKFAIKSGGHNTNQGWSSVNGGVLIAMSSNAATNISADRLTADIGPGSRWGAAESALEPYGKAVVGGRIGDVGVGGYVLGTGLSFLSGQYGMACDSVTNFEVVLANATIVNANATSNPDLFFSLKGGGNQFGIVTKITMKTVPVGQVWGGIRSYVNTPNVTSTMIQAIHDFTVNYSDPKAAMIITAERTDILDIWVVFYFYNGPIAPNGTFGAFETLTPLSDSTKTQSFASLLAANDNVNLEGLRYLIRGTTVPAYPGKSGVDLLRWSYDTWAAQAVTATITNPDFIYSMAFQPFPVAIPKASQAESQAIGVGNTLNLDPNAGDHVWYEFDISWLTALGDDDAHSQAMQITNNIDAYARSHYTGMAPAHYQGVDSDDSNEAGDTGLTYQLYNPVFANDAMYDQKPYQSYPTESYERMTSAKAEYDPNGFFTNRTGGFKL